MKAKRWLGLNSSDEGSETAAGESVVEGSRGSEPASSGVIQTEDTTTNAVRAPRVKRQLASHQCVVAYAGSEIELPKFEWASTAAIRQEMMQLKRTSKGTLSGQKIKK